jgi:hypothetical protein
MHEAWGARIGFGAALLATAVAVACAPKAGRRQTDVMEKTGVVGVSAPVLRARVDDLAEHLAGRLEEMCDRIRAESRDPVVRRRALRAKIEGIPAVYSAAYRVDPLEAAMDVWALAFQLSHFVREGAGSTLFGDLQPLAHELAEDVIADADALVRSIAVGPEAFADTRAKVERWASLHPIERNFMSRPSVATSMAEFRSERDAFVAVGAVTDTLENLSERLNTYAAQLPKQARWQAELLAADLPSQPEVAGALGDVHALGETGRLVNELLADMPGLMGVGSPAHTMIASERKAALAGVNAQRLQTLEYVTVERVATLAALQQERIAVLAALHQERVETLREVDAIKTRAVESAFVGLRETVDYALVRIAVLMLLLIVSSTVLGVVGYRLTLGRRRAAASTT